MNKKFLNVIRYKLRTESMPHVIIINLQTKHMRVTDVYVS